MENLIVNTKKDGEKKEDNSLSKTLVRKLEPKHVRVLNIRKSKTSEIYLQKLFLGNIRCLENRIPKRIVSFDEVYLRRCHELIRTSALRAASFSIYSEIGVCPRGDTHDLASFVIECPLEATPENVVLSSAGDWIIGTITGSKSMVNILKSPLFHKLGAVDYNVNFGGTSLIDDKEPPHSGFISSPGGFGISSSQNLQKEMVVLGDHKYESDDMHKRLVSISSTSSSFSFQSSSSASAAVSQGMLLCTWQDGLPHYIFSVDDHKEVYVANLFKVESPVDKVLDYIYMFHSGSGGKKECEIREEESDLVGRMRVSTSITLCPNNSEVMETQFVLFGSNYSSLGEMQSSSHNLRKNKGLSKKMVDVFRTSQSYKQRTPSKFGGTSAAILENSPWEPCEDGNINSDSGRANLLDNYFLPNFELAAIIVKDHIRDNRKESKIGGWGLKFLKKSKQTSASQETSLPSQCCLRNSGDCSTSVDVLVPAGFHGGPRTRSGGPSSLTERWRSGGHCDCGGWDIGCPLTVLNTRSSKTEVSPQAEIPGECKTFDLYIQGSQQSTPIMKMTNIHDGLYYIHFQSTLSELQSLSIAVANIHTHSPTLRPRVCRS